MDQSATLGWDTFYELLNELNESVQCVTNRIEATITLYENHGKYRLGEYHDTELLSHKDR